MSVTSLRCVPQWTGNLNMIRAFRKLLRCKWAATGTAEIAQSVLMGGVNGALVYVTAAPGVAFVRRTEPERETL
jgi:hypothetical protein